MLNAPSNILQNSGNLYRGIVITLMAVTALVVAGLFADQASAAEPAVPGNIQLNHAYDTPHAAGGSFERVVFERAKSRTCDLTMVRTASGVLCLDRIIKTRLIVGSCSRQFQKLTVFKSTSYRPAVVNISNNTAVLPTVWTAPLMTLDTYGSCKAPVIVK